jgi:hypothetical protein
MEPSPQKHAVMHPQQTTELGVDQRARLVSEVVEVAVEDKQIRSGQRTAGADQAIGVLAPLAELFPNRHLIAKAAVQAGGDRLSSGWEFVALV